MPDPRPVPVSEDSEEARALLQTRVALFWKVIFFIILLGSGLGVDRGGQRSQAWTFCSRWRRPPMPASSGGCPGEGRGPSGSLELMESGGLLLNSAIGALTGALPAGGVCARAFARERRGRHDGRRLRVDAATRRHGDDGRHSRRPDPLVASSHRHRHRLVRRSDDPGDDAARAGRRWRARVARARLARLSVAACHRRHDVGLCHHHVHRHLVGHLRPPGRGSRGPPARPVRARTERSAKGGWARSIGRATA